MFISPSDTNFIKTRLKKMSFLLPGALLATAAKGAKKMKKNPTVHNVFTPGVHGKDYNDLAQANPYMNVTYRQSWIQKLLEGLGFRTNKDAYLESMALQAQEYDNQISQKEYNEKYDSAIEQVRRERLAGINPDLAGDVSAGDSQAPVDDGNPPISPEADDLSIVQNFASGILSGVQAAFGLAGDIQNLRNLKLGNESKMMSMVKDAFGMIVPDLYDEFSNSKTGEVSRVNYYDLLKPHYGHVMSRKQFDNFVRRVNAFGNSAEGKSLLYSTQSSKAKNRKSMFSEIADPDQYSEWDDIMYDIADELSSLAFDVQKSTLQNQKRYQQDVVPEELANKEAFEQAYDPTTAAKLAANPDDLAMKSNARDLSDYNKSLRSTFSNIMKDLDRRSDRGNKVAPIVKAVLSVWLMGLLPSSPISVNTGTRNYTFESKQ